VIERAGTTFSLLDSTGVVLQTETETLDADIYWSDTGSARSMGAVSTPADGRDYLQLRATGQRAGVSSAGYRCGLHLAL